MLIPFYCSTLPEDAELLALAQQMASDWSDKRFRRRSPTADRSAGAEAAAVGSVPVWSGWAQPRRRCGVR